MAYILPTTPPGNLTPEALRVFRFLKALPDNVVVWRHLAPWQKHAPDFLVLTSEARGMLVKVSRATSQAASSASQLLLLGDKQPDLGTVETKELADFVNRLPESARDKVATVIVFPNVPEKTLRQQRPPGAPPMPLWFGQEAIQTGQDSPWRQALNCDPILAADIEKMRALFTPEIVVPENMTVRPPNPRRLEAGLTGYLLDYNQELALKADLSLPDGGETLARDFQLNVVNGVAGSGKTLILLYRLRLLHGYFPDKRFLVLTHNRPLIRDLQARYRLLAGEDSKRIEWHTFNKWCWANWPKRNAPAWVSPVSKGRREALLQETWKAVLAGTTISQGMLESEIDWFKDQLLFSKDDYLKAERRGRGFRLSAEQRIQMANAIFHYQELLNRTREQDWGDVPRKMWRFIKTGVVVPQPYDVVLVDEAQFFAPIWFDIIRGLVRPQTGHLFLVADPTQGFLGRGASWRSFGLEVRGRSQQLKRSYRTTQEIFSFARLFYRQRIPKDDAEEEILEPDLLNLPPGVVPQSILLESGQDEIARVANEVAAFVNSGLPRSHILALHANWQGVNMLIAALQKRLGPKAAFDPKDRIPGDYVRVTTINAGTGLESPIVFLVGLNQLFETEQSLRISDEDRERLILENTRKVYMAATRAGQRLVFTYVGELPSALKHH